MQSFYITKSKLGSSTVKNLSIQSKKKKGRRKNRHPCHPESLFFFILHVYITHPCNIIQSISVMLCVKMRIPKFRKINSSRIVKKKKNILQSDTIFFFSLMFQIFSLHHQSSFSSSFISLKICIHIHINHVLTIST